MKLKALSIGAALAALIALPSAALAAWGQTTGALNLRTGPAAYYQRITTMPAGARVWISGSVNGWYRVSYHGISGYASGSYITTRMVAPQPSFRRPPPPTWGYYRKPWWDRRHGAWYDGRRWYRNGIWFSDPSGFSFGFSFR